MKLVTLPSPEAYNKNGKYRVYEASASIEWGIKIHVSATTENAQKIASVVLPILCSKNVRHKIIEDLDSIATTEQLKKFITVYPQSKDEFEYLLDHLDAALIHLCRGRIIKIGIDPITGDMAYGYSGYLFMRYGNFLKDDKKDDRTQVSPKLIDYLLNDTDVFELSYRAKRARELLSIEIPIK